MAQYDALRLPCGGTAYFDEGSGCAHRCKCGAVVGSVGMPRECKSALDKYNIVLPALGSKIRWDFYRGREVE
jgi:hypothetical protein